MNMPHLKTNGFQGWQTAVGRREAGSCRLREQDGYFRYSFTAHNQTLIMKHLLLTGCLLLLAAGVSAQIDTADKKALQQVLDTFMGSIREKDSTRFFQLFYREPVSWTGVYGERTQAARLKKNPSLKENHFRDDYRDFIRGIVTDPDAMEEKFYNIRMTGDGAVATISFDYSFWSNGVKGNWGHEAWTLIKADGSWKITSLIFSMEFEKVLAEPADRK